jgi:IS5 family transposase
VVYDSARNFTRRERFLHAMEAVLPWARVEALVALHCPTAGRSRHPLPLATMLRV